MSRTRVGSSPGTEVAIISSGGWHTHLYRTTTIEKVGKRDITLTGVQRKFRLADLHEQGRDKYYGDQIIPVDSDRYRGIVAGKALQEKKNAAHTAVERWQSSKESVERMTLAIVALTEYRDAYTADGDDSEL